MPPHAPHPTCALPRARANPCERPVALSLRICKYLVFQFLPPSLAQRNRVALTHMHQPIEMLIWRPLIV
jgi:hypothetical protein